MTTKERILKANEMSESSRALKEFRELAKTELGRGAHPIVGDYAFRSARRKGGYYQCIRLVKAGRDGSIRTVRFQMR